MSFHTERKLAIPITMMEGNIVECARLTSSWRCEIMDEFH